MFGRVLAPRIKGRSASSRIPLERSWNADANEMTIISPKLGSGVQKRVRTSKKWFFRVHARAPRSVAEDAESRRDFDVDETVSEIFANFEQVCEI